MKSNAYLFLLMLVALLAMAAYGPQLTAPLKAAIPQRETGFISAYNYRPTLGTLNYRAFHGQLPTDWPEYAGFIAVRDCSRIGEEAILSSPRGDLRVLVFDCAGKNATRWLNDGFVAEIDAALRYEGGYPIGTVQTVTFLGTKCDKNCTTPTSKTMEEEWFKTRDRYRVYCILNGWRCLSSD